MGSISEQLQALMRSGAERWSRAGLFFFFFGGRGTYPATYGCRTKEEMVGNGCSTGRLEELDG